MPSVKPPVAPARYLLLLMLLLPVCTAAQSTDPCYSDPALSVCGLDNSALDYVYDPLAATSTASLDFRTHSCKWQANKNRCQKAADYLVRMDGDNNSSAFLLTGPGGTLAVNLSYTDGAGNTLALPASGGSVTASGTISSQATSISATLVTDPQTLAPGPYSGTFSLTASQTGGCSPDCGYLGNIQFTVSVTIPTRIAVRRFDNVDISSGITPGQPIERSEDFCVGGIGFERYSVILSSGNGATGGAGGTSPFQLNGSFDSLPYTVAFTDNTGSNNGITADSTGNINGTFPRADGLNCTVDNARVIISVATADWESASESSYTDALTITVTTQ